MLRSKFGKSREVPLHPSTVEALGRYARQRDQLCPQPRSASFFLTMDGTRLVYRTVHSVFHRLLRHAGLGTQPGRRRPADPRLRHTFAVNTLTGWYRAGADVPALLPLLSTYMGHTDPVYLLVLLRFPGYSDTRSLARVMGPRPGMTCSGDCRLSG